MEYIKLAILTIIAALIALNIKNIKNEYGVLVSVAACIIIFFYGMSKLSAAIDTLKYITSYMQIDDKYIVIVFKIIGITYISEFATDICKDCGFNTLGSQISIFGKLSTIAISMPVLVAIVKTISNLLGQ